MYIIGLGANCPKRINKFKQRLFMLLLCWMSNKFHQTQKFNSSFSGEGRSISDLLLAAAKCLRLVSWKRKMGLTFQPWDIQSFSRAFDWNCLAMFCGKASQFAVHKKAAIIWNNNKTKLGLNKGCLRIYKTHWER